MAEPKPGDVCILRLRPTWIEGYTSCAGLGSIVEVVEVEPGGDEPRFLIQTIDGALAVVPIEALNYLPEG